MSGYGQALSFANKNKGKAASGAKAGGKFAVAHKEEVKKAGHVAYENRETVKKGATTAYEHREQVQQGAQFAYAHQDECKQGAQFAYQNKETIQQGGELAYKHREAIEQTNAAYQSGDPNAAFNTAYQNREALKECGEFGVQNREVLAEGADLAAKNPELARAAGHDPNQLQQMSQFANTAASHEKELAYAGVNVKPKPVPPSKPGSQQQIQRGTSAAATPSYGGNQNYGGSNNYGSSNTSYGGSSAYSNPSSGYKPPPSTGSGAGGQYNNNAYSNTYSNPNAPKAPQDNYPGAQPSYSQQPPSTYNRSLSTPDYGQQMANINLGGAPAQSGYQPGPARSGPPPPSQGYQPGPPTSGYGGPPPVQRAASQGYPQPNGQPQSRPAPAPGGPPRPPMINRGTKPSGYVPPPAQYSNGY